MVAGDNVGTHHVANGPIESGGDGKSSTIKGKRIIIAPKIGGGVPLGGGIGLSKLGRSNALALSQGEEVHVVRAPVLTFLSVPGTFKRAYKLPGGAKRTAESEMLVKRKTLGLRKSFTPMLPGKFKMPGPETIPVVSMSTDSVDDYVEDHSPQGSLENVDAYEPLILWQSAEGCDDPPHSVSVDPRLCKFLRPHQREGVQFMYECVMGARDFDGSGCILADDMGLGKTLQSIAVMWTLLTQGQEKGTPTAKRCIVVCPTSLVKNWESEIGKWLNGDCKCLVLSESTRKDVVASITLFLSMPQYKVLILSYETFRIHSSQFTSGKYRGSPCDLMICDEAHRLKNCETATSRSLAALPCRRHILLSGTPMQNDLDEFYAMVNFTNPGVLGTPQFFRKHYLNPILIGREPGATESEERRALLAQNKMSRIVNEFILRRTNTINAQHLPPKLTQIVACRLTDVQEPMYRRLLNSKEVNHILSGKQTNVLSQINMIQKLCNHPSLVLDTQYSSSEGSGNNGSLPHQLRAELLSMIPPPDSTTAPSSHSGLPLGRRNSRSGGPGSDLVHPEWSGKMEWLFRLMESMRAPGSGDDRIVIVSNYTSCLNLIVRLCRENNWTFVRLDGSTGISKRKKMVDDFNDPQKGVFAFLLSSKAGGCGLNLIGGNRLVLFDPDWNPAVDKQAAARVWRDHQTKKCYIYRLVSTGTIEEKIFQRQLSKEGLQSIVDDKTEVNSLSSKELRNLFQLVPGSPCDTHDKLQCQRCGPVPATSLNSVYEEACKRALPRQLAICTQLLERIAAEPIAKPFLGPLDPTVYGCTRGEFEERVKEPIDLNIVLQRLSNSNSQRVQVTKDSEGGSKTLEAAIASIKADTEYHSVPAFVKDVNMVFSIPGKVWRNEPTHPLQIAANDMKRMFDKEWAVLVQDVLGLRDSALADLSDAKRQGLTFTNEKEQRNDNGGEMGNGTKLLGFQEQLGMPAEEDLNNWSHHFSTDTVDDEIFQRAIAGTGDRIVSFVFGLEVTWSRLQAREFEIAKEAATKQDQEKIQIPKAADEEEESKNKNTSSQAASDGSSTGIMTGETLSSEEESEIVQDYDLLSSPSVLGYDDNSGTDNDVEERSALDKEHSDKENESCNVSRYQTKCAEDDNQLAYEQCQKNSDMKGDAPPSLLNNSRDAPLCLINGNSLVDDGERRGIKTIPPSLVDQPPREKKKYRANDHCASLLHMGTRLEEDLAVGVNQKDGDSCAISSGSAAYVASADQLFNVLEESCVVQVSVDETSVPLQTLSEQRSAAYCNQGDPILAEQWECGLCTFINSASNKKCTMCATRLSSKTFRRRKSKT